MKTIILGGFLGAGKTTVLLQLARYLVERSDASRPNQVVILENEIGEVGVDDMLLKSNGYQVSEMFAGCACCTMAGELRGNIRILQRELDPQWLIIEATGVAYPMNIKQTVDPLLESPAEICTLIDAKRFLRLLIPARELIVSQLEDARVILINKIDTVEPQTLDEIQSRVTEINARAAVFRVIGLEPIDPAIWKCLAAQPQG